jgi:pyruvate ferredoxin oxidoreductase gamma subunit/phenylglyoxylate dehydrogenase gamma subunit
MSPKGVWVQATKKSLDQLQVPETVSKVGLCDAFGIALDVFGRTITNSIMLGSFAKTTGLVSLESLHKGMETVAFRDAALDKNIQAMQRGFEETSVFDIDREEGS